MDAFRPAFVYFAADIDATRQCYETIGFAFVEEKHAEGPVHFACAFGDVVLEIYPLPDGAAPKPCGGFALILHVRDFDGIRAGLKAMDLRPTNPTVYDSERGLRACSVRDPDGKLVRLLELDPSAVQ